MANSLCDSIAGESVFEDLRRSQAVLEFMEDEGPEEVENILRKIGFNVKKVILKIEYTIEEDVAEIPGKTYRSIEPGEEED